VQDVLAIEKKDTAQTFYSE